MMRIYPKSLLQAAAILVSFLLYIQPLAAQTAVQPQGAGTAASPYLISNWQELYWISQNTSSWNKQFLQTADIDLAQAVPSIKSWNTNTGWTPIGKSSTNFSGNYDGGGYVINGLYINRPSSSDQALYGYTSTTAKIQNLGISGAEVIGDAKVGILVGYHSGNISNCYTSGSVTASRRAGGLVGVVYYGRLSNSFSRASVSTLYPTDLGGFAGSNTGGSITNCYSTGRVRCAIGNLPADIGFVGAVWTGGSYAMSGNYWDTESSGQLATHGIASGKTTTEMQQQLTFENWDFTDIWSINPLINAGYPYLKNISIEQLYKPEVLIGTALSTNDAIKVSGEFVFAGKSGNAICGFLLNTTKIISIESSGHIAKHDIGELEAYTEIGTLFTGLAANTDYYVCAYTTNEYGTLYSPVLGVKTTEQISTIPQGDGTVASPYLISNWKELYWISQTSTSWNKQFLQTADIDLAQAVPSVRTWNLNTGWTPIGNYDTKFSGKYNGGGYTINALYINRPKLNYQALFGCTDPVAEIHNLGVTGAVFTGKEYVGVLVGYHRGNISNCFTSGSVSSSYSNAGGFAGCVNAGGRISNSFSHASVNRLIGDTYTNFGGFAGKNSGGSITNCYSTGRVSYATDGSPTKNGFLGYSSDGSMSGNYWDTQTSGQTSTAGAASGRPTAEMKQLTTFAGWDFADIWAIDPQRNDGYPYLQNSSTKYLQQAKTVISEVLLTIEGIKVKGSLISTGNSAKAVCGFLLHSNTCISLEYAGHIAKHDIGEFSTSTEMDALFLFAGLAANTDYYVCAYATNEYGTFYSPIMNIKTSVITSAVLKGDGTLSSPYLISNILELLAISQTPTIWDKNFLQTADIDLAQAEPSIINWNKSTGWSPIGNSTTKFSGNYDGGGYIINGLYINRPNPDDYQALFGYTSATAEIHNLGVTGAQVVGDWYVGVLVGHHSGNISNCFTTGSVSAHSYGGGFVGYVNTGGRISNSFSRASGSMAVENTCGGFAGLNINGSITNCYSTGRVSFSKGGSPANKGFVGGVSPGNSYAMSGNYWDTQSSGHSSTAGIATGKNTEEMKQQATFAGWDFNNIWTIDPHVDSGYPYLSKIKNGLSAKAAIQIKSILSARNEIKVDADLIFTGIKSNVVCGFLINTNSNVSFNKNE
jgi:hypothetical protein